MTQTAIGQAGEQAACDYLKRGHYRIVDRNYKAACGEIDLIGYDHEILCFIEVKTRRCRYFGQAAAAVTPDKMRKIILTAQLYLLRQHLECPCRFDVIECYYDANWHFNLIKGAFENNL